VCERLLRPQFSELRMQSRAQVMLVVLGPVGLERATIEESEWHMLYPVLANVKVELRRSGATPAPQAA